MTLSNGLPQKEFNDLLGNVREFRDEIVTPNVIDWERARTFPSDAISSASNLGLLGMEIPPEMGGLGLSFSQKLKVLDTFSEVSMPYAFSLVNSHNVAARPARQLGARRARAPPASPAAPAGSPARPLPPCRLFLFGRAATHPLVWSACGALSLRSAPL